MGSSNKAQRAAEKAEAERKAQIARSITQIDAAYDSPSRQAGYDDFIAALREQFGTDLNRQRDVNDRQRTFAMARAGLTSGSADVDAARLAGEEYSQALLNAENQAQGALAGLKGQDEAARLNLIQLAQSGNDMTSSAARVGAQLQSAAQAAKSNALSQGLGDVFGGSAKVYRDQRDAAERRRGFDSASGPYGNSPYR